MNPLRTILCLAACAAAALAPPPAHAGPGAGASRVVIVSWDGAPDWVLDRLVPQGKLPNVARLEAMGARAEYSTAAYPSKTACGHASIWTGAFPDVNGVTGNWVPLLPRSGHTVLENSSGFDAAALTAEPIWVTAAKAGKRVTVASATQAFPADRWVQELRAAGVPDERYALLSGFESVVAEPAILDGSTARPAAGWADVPAHTGAMRELSFAVGDSQFFVLVFDDPADPARGFDTVLISQDGKGGDPGAVRRLGAPPPARAVLKPSAPRDDVSGFSPRFRVSKDALSGFTYFRLWALSPDGSMTLYQRGVHAMRGSESEAELDAYMDAYGGFHDDIFWNYQAGQLGAPIGAGGDGLAERRIVEAVRFDVELRKRGTRYAIEHWRPDLLIHYTSTTDSAGHTWIGALDPNGPRYDAALAARLWPYYEEVFRLEDGWLGEIMAASGPGAAFFLVSDHGMTAHAKTFFPNAVLARAGLLGWGGKDGREIDVAKTKACVPPFSDFFAVVNGTDWKGGVVGAADREAVLAAATDALLSATDPETGRRVVTAVFRAEAVAGLGAGGPAGGDLYLELAPGYYPDNAYSAVPVSATDSPIGYGAHGFLPLRRSMQAICVVGGAGVIPGAKLPPVRQIDVAPTAARLLGIPPPRDARGHVLGEILR